jgi:hypothetical protein
VIPEVLKRIKDALDDNPANIDVSKIAKFYAEEFAYFRRVRAEREILFPLGLDFDRYLGRQATMAHYQVRDIDARLTAHHIDATAIIAGIDPTGAHIFKIRDPGVAESMDTPNFACAGSGEWLAATQFMLAKYDKTWPFSKALWLTFSAKARSEVAGGVGEKTDLVTIFSPNNIYSANDEQKERLYRIFKNAIAKEGVARAEAEAEIDQYVKSYDRAQAANVDRRQTASTGDERPAAPPESYADLVERYPSGEPRLVTGQGW